MFSLEGIVYLIFFLFSMPLVFQVLIALNLESKFQKNAIWQIKVGYIIITLIASHLLAQMMVTLYFLF